VTTGQDEASWKAGFETDLMTFELTDPDTLMVDTYTQFLDHSGRENYHVRELFRKVIPLPRPPLPRPGPWPF